MTSRKLITLVAAMVLTACASTSFEYSWKDPSATPLQIEGSKVAAIAMMESPASRRAAEDALVRELNARGAEGVPMYTIMPGASPGNEAEVREALNNMGFAGAVVLRPVETRTEIVSSPQSIFLGPNYFRLWDGYYSFGWHDPWRFGVAADVRTRRIVSVEVLVYSLRQNRLVWGGQTSTADPATVERLVETTAKRVVTELKRQGLLPVAAGKP